MNKLSQIIIIFFACTVMVAYAKEPLLSGLGSIAYIKLEMYQRNGEFEGFVSFYDARGNTRRIIPPFTCRKKSQDVRAVLLAPKHNVLKVLDVRAPNFIHHDFENKSIYAYRIEPFSITGLKKGENVQFEFRWCDKKAVETVFILEEKGSSR